MEIKVGQWVRWSNGNFHQIDLSFYELTIDEIKEENAKVANDPRELIQVGDLVEYQAGEDILIDKVRKIIDDFVYMQHGYLGTKRLETVAIYTPRSDNTQYIEQWRA